MRTMKESATLRTSAGVITVTFEIHDGGDKAARSAINPKKHIANPYRLSITGSYPHGGGQCVGELRRLGADIPEVIALADVWDRWHLNDMRGGTVKQRDHLKVIGYKGDYVSAKAALTAAGLNPDRGYVYGSAWLYEALPESVLDVWTEAKAAMEAVTAARDAAIAAEAERAEDGDDEDAREAHEIIGEERGINAGLLKLLADHLSVSLDDAADYHEEHYSGQWRSAAEWAENFAEDIGETGRNNGQSWPFNHIDWSAAAQELLDSDYFEIEDGGDVHIYRNA